MDKANAKQAEAQAAARRVLSAYRQVFGVEGYRSDAQRIVWEDMKARARVEFPVFVAGPDGSLCPMRAANADGARMYFLQLSEFLKARDEEVAAPEVKK